MSVWRLLFLCFLLCLALAALPAAAATPFEMIVAGELAYGIPHDVAIKDNYAYVAAQGAVSVLDITNPAHPVQVAVVDTPGSAEGIAVSGNYVYVADWDSGLRIIDITNPLAAHEVGHYDTPGFAYGVAVSGNYAYVADHAAGLQIINVATKSSPTFAGHFDTPGYSWKVAVSGSYAYVADGFAGMRVLDVSNPASPVAVGSYPATDSVMGVAVSGSYAYLADGTAGLQIVQIDAGPPYSLVGHLSLSGRASGVFVSTDKAYVAADTAGLQVVDVTDPANPALVDSFDTTGRALAVAVSGTAAYVADDSGGLRVVEIAANPAPVVVGHAATAGNAEAVAIQDDVAYVADGNGGVRAFDVTNITAPQQLWACGGSTQAMDVAVDADNAYVADWNGALEVLGISGPSVPVCDVGSVDIVGGHPNGVTLAGSRAYVAAGDVGLAIVDVSDPAVPSVLNTISTSGSANGIAVSGDYAYVANGSAGLKILDVSSPSGAAVVGTGGTSPGYAWDVDVANNYAYLACGDSGLEIFNVTDPANPIATAAPLALSGSAHSVALKDNYAFVSVGGRGVVVVNVSDPAHPAIVTSCGTPSVPGPSDLAIAGGYAYVADAESGLVIVDIVSPYVELAALESPAYGRRLAVTEPADHTGVGYMAAGPQGLQIVQVTSSEDADNPSLVRSNRSLGEVTDVALATGTAYVTDASGRLSVLNLGNPTNPYTVSSVVTSGSALGVATTTIDSSSYALAAGGYAGLSTVATSGLVPSEVAVSDTPGWCSDVAATTLAGDPFALVADGDAGLRLFNLSPVGTPAVTVFSEGFELDTSLQGWTTGGSVDWYSGTQRRGTHSARLRMNGSIERTISTVGYGRVRVTFYLGASLDSAPDYVLAQWSPDGGASWNTIKQMDFGDADEDGVLHFVDSNLLNATAADNPSFRLRFAVYGDSLNDAAFVDDIKVTSESSSQPNEVGFYNTGGQANGIATSGNYALVADGERGLRVIDVTSPGSPLEVGYLDTAGYAEAVTTYNAVAVVADGNNGLVLVDFSIPTGPKEIAHFSTPGWAADVKVLNGFAWVADTGWGLSILQLWYSFRDILFGNWAFFEIEDAVTNGITLGYPDGKYHPEITCSRDQIAVFIARALAGGDANVPEPPAGQETFKDIASGSDPNIPQNWAWKYIEYLADRDIVQGYIVADNIYYRPTLAVDRASMAAFMSRAVAGGDAAVDAAVEDPTLETPALFTDVLWSHWAYKYIYFCVHADELAALPESIVRGYSDGYYRPSLPVTRDQMAVFIWRAFLQ